MLVGLRDYQDEKADVIMKYTADEARVLKQYGELPEHLRINDTGECMTDAGFSRTRLGCQQGRIAALPQRVRGWR